MLLNFNAHLFYHVLHFLEFGRELFDIVLHFRVLENTFGAEHLAIVLTVEFYFLLAMDLAISNRICWLLALVGSLSC